MGKEDCIHWGNCSKASPEAYPRSCGSAFCSDYVEKQLPPSYLSTPPTEMPLPPSDCATDQPATDTESDCIYDKIGTTDFCGVDTEGRAFRVKSCGLNCPGYTAEQPAASAPNKCIHDHERGLTCPKAEVMFPPKPHCGPDCPDYATEQPISNSTWAVKQNQKTNCFHRQVSECCGYEWCGKGYESSLPCSFNCYYYADEQLVAQGMARPLVYNPPPDDLQPPEKPPPPRPEKPTGVKCFWYNPDNFCAIAYPPKSLPVRCGPDCTDYFIRVVAKTTTVDPKLQQPKQLRPFVQIDGAGIIFLNDFVLFQVVDKSLNALGQTAIKLYTYETDEQAQAALDQIQAAIKHWNKLALEPECTCDSLEQNVRLKSITENLDYKSAKARMIEAFTRNDIDAYEIDTLVSISDVWTALSAIMLLTEDFDIPEDQTDVP